MRRIILIARQEFLATVSSRGFIIGLVFMPAIVAVGVLASPRLFDLGTPRIVGDVAIVDSTGRVVSELRAALDPREIASRRVDDSPQALARSRGRARPFSENAEHDGAATVTVDSLPELHLVELPITGGLREQKAWLNSAPVEQGRRRLALIVIHPDAVMPADGKSVYGAYDLYVPADLDYRAGSEIQRSVRAALINARIHARALEKEAIDAIVRVPRVRSITVTKESEERSAGPANVMLPFAFGSLLFIGIVTGGQSLLTSTIEDKSSRVLEVLLSAVSPVELMAGKLLGQMTVSLAALGLYVGLGVAMLRSVALFGLLNPWLIVCLVVFFVITYLVFGSVMMTIGCAVNEAREAQWLMMPIMMLLILCYALSVPISRDPNSMLSTIASFMPPVNTFAMLLRMSTPTPPPWWQICLSIVIGIGSVGVALWFTAKIFRIGLLMHGKPPNFSTLIRWARAA
jgi:ABC-type Na+ efflux pump permease subunit